MRNLLIAHLFEIAEENNLTKVYWQLREGVLDGLLLNARQQNRLGSVVCCRFRGSIVCIKGNAGSEPRPRCQESVAQDPVNPGAEIRTLAEGGETFKGFHVCLLNQVFGRGSILSEPAGEVEEPREVRHRQVFKGSEIAKGIGHGTDSVPQAVRVRSVQAVGLKCHLSSLCIVRSH